MTTLAGYSLAQTVREDGEFVLRRGCKESERSPILALIPVADQPAPHCLRRLEHEYALKDELDPRWACRPLELVRQDGRLFLILEDAGGETLDGLIAREMTLTQILRTAVGLCRALGRVHQRGLIHKDLKPANVIVNVATGAIHLTGFGIASRLPRERQAPEASETLAGTLAYMAPEQTGRMNRSIDSRSDLYSLGVTLYEMLTQVLPFAASDPLEWVHCHIARQPLSPVERVPQLPFPLSAMVMKLLSKIPEDRYQTAHGIEADLQTCLADWEAHQQIQAFGLGGQDASGRLLIPEKLYGRERESQQLIDAFERVVAVGALELVLVSGYSGVGKSSLVNELHKVIVPPRGLFASGKFDQYKRDIPYATLAEAFAALVRQVLGKSEAEVARWREAIQEAVGQNGQLIVDLIPDLALVLGKQPPVVQLPPSDAQNRFNAVFRRFIAVFAQPSHPLVLFLDDLQWLDLASLAFFEHLVSHSDLGHLLLIGAYRDNEVTAAHRLMLTLETIRKSRINAQEIILAPLSLVDTGHLLADTLRCSPARAQPLAQLVHEKTAGNPFFAIQFVTTLHEEGLLEFDTFERQWRWDVERIRAKNFTDNVVDLMVAKLKRLSAPTLEALRWLGCLGRSASTTTLGALLGQTEEETHASLWEAVLAGLLFRERDAYTFLHDRVQEAAEGLIPEEHKAEWHLRVGRRLLANTPPEARAEKAFDLVNQFNQGIALVADPAERDLLSRLNALAGRKAKGAIAYSAARNYLRQAQTLLPEDAWRARYAETFDLHLDLAECEYLDARFDRADRMFEDILGKAASHADKAKIYGLRARLCQGAGRYPDAMMFSLQALSLLGVTFPASNQDLQAAMETETAQIPTNLGGRRIEELADAPLATDPDVQATIALLAEALPCAYIARPNLFPLLLLKALNVSLSQGSTADSTVTYLFYSIFLIAVRHDIPSGVAYSKMMLRLNERLHDIQRKGFLSYLHGATAMAWKEHFARTLPIMNQAWVDSLAVGDLLTVCYSSQITIWHSLETGAPLDQVLTEARHKAAFAKQCQNQAAYQNVLVHIQFINCLKGLTRDLSSFDDESFDEARSFELMTQANFRTGIACFHILKQVTALFYGRYAEAQELATKAELFLPSMATTTFAAAHAFHRALAMTALYPDASPAQQREFSGALEAILEQHERWAEHCPENFLHRLELVSAEMARIDGRDLDAIRLYERAIRSAKENGFIQYESLAHEMAARFCLGRGGYETMASGYLRNARQGYLRWGALGKVKQLDQLYPGIETQTALGPTATVGTPLEQLDLMTVVKASQAVSGQIVLQNLIEKLLCIAVEHAGAQRGLLILIGERGPLIEAEATTLGNKIEVRLGRTKVTEEALPLSAFHLALRTRERLILDDALVPNAHSEDPYVLRRRPRAVLCLPLLKQTELVGLLYLENNLTPHAFTPARIAVLEVLASQAAISMENARLYAGLEKENAERKRAEERFSKAFHSSPSPMAIARAKDNSFIDVNARFLATFGYTREDFIGHSTQELGLGEPVNLDQALELLYGSGALHDFQFQGRTREGKPLSLLVSVETIEVEGEACFLSTFIDMTERKRIEEQLRQSQKMEAIGRLAGGIAHDFNNLLTGINGYSSLALRGMAASNPVRSSIEEVLKCGERATSLTRQLLAYSRKQVFETKLWRLNEIVDGMGGILRRLIGADIELVTSLSPTLGLTRVDRGQMEQVILNLVLNARDAMPRGGRLYIQTKNTMIDDAAPGTQLDVAHGAQVVLAVSDTGMGMTPDTQARLFEPFFTTKAVGEGTGLGLSVVYGIVQQSGGSISVYSELGKGSTFRIYLPEVRDAQEVEPDALAPETLDLYRGDETILLVEDEVVVRNFAREVLESQGYTLLQATNGREALRLLRSAQPIGLVVTDMIMPKMGGRALAKRVRKIWPALPVLFVSGYAERFEAEGRTHEKELFLQKPFSPLQLAKQVRALLDGAAPSDLGQRGDSLPH